MKKNILAIPFLLSILAYIPVCAKPLVTTTIGAFPKPWYITLPDWFKKYRPTPSTDYDQYLQGSEKNTVEDIYRATHEVVKKQVELGIEIPTEGEIPRENYIYYFCRSLKGINFAVLTSKSPRNGALSEQVPTIIDQISCGPERVMVRDYHIAQSATTHPVKITIPGPMTISDSIANRYYENEEELGRDLAQAINAEVKALAEAGCKVIQIDEPVFARKPEQALSYGIKHLEACFAGIGSEVEKVVHICCGYFTYLDQADYVKADPGSYALLAPALDKSSIDAISIEDAHRRNDPSLFEKFKHKKVILGVIDVSRSRIETVDEIEEHIRQALMHIDADRLLLAPDCGLGFLSLDMIEKKLTNMLEARARILNA